MNTKAIHHRRRLPVLAGIALAFLLLQESLYVSGAVAAGIDATGAPHKLCLWRVSGGKGTVFLLGSIHVGKPDLYPLPREIEQAFTSAQYLVEEADPSKVDPTEARQFWLSHGRYPDGDRLEKHLSDRTSMALGLYLEMTGRSPTALSRARPWMAYMIIHKERLQGYGYLGKQGIDRHFFDEAAASRKPVIGLETPEYQMNLVYWMFSRLPEDDQDKLLASALLRARNDARGLGATFEAWRAGCTAAIEALDHDGARDPQSQVYKEEMVYKRNLRMAQALESYLDTPYTYFTVVGLAHVIGDRGIVKLLQGKGYRVDQLVGH
jgi:uncharacterized protein YbaP (TraB family)